MSRKISFACVVLFSSFALAAGLSAWEERVVPARSLPVPLTVSPEMQRIIAASPPEIPVPKTTAEWIKSRKEHDTQSAQGLRGLVQGLKAKITPVTIAGISCYKIEPAVVAKENENRLLMNLHGGGFVWFGGEAGAGEAVVVATATKMRAIAVDYRMPPQHPFPAALDDSVAVWKALAAKHDPKRMAIFGSSAGGNLTMATVLKAKRLGLPMPGAIFLGTPASDLSKTGDSLWVNKGVDNTIVEYDGFIAAAFKLYAGKEDMKAPLVSPVYGDLKGFPPAILISGTRDLLLSATVRAHRALRAADVEADLHVFEGQAHAQYLIGFTTPEGVEALGEVARFLGRKLK